MTDRQWLDAFAARLGVPPPTERECELALRLAAVAAHASQRTAAPLACWLSARADVDLEQAILLAEGVASPAG